MSCGYKDQLSMNVYETGFALDEAQLYLNTHPTDQEAMNYYQQVRRLNQDAVRAYEEVHGPLMFNQVNSNNWSWVKGPWPWEGGMR